HTTPHPTYTPSLHDALPIWQRQQTVVPVASRDELQEGSARRRERKAHGAGPRLARRRLSRDQERHPTGGGEEGEPAERRELVHRDRKSTRLNSSHLVISYAV